jgi:transcriptional regulator with XRE-family HTH domain
MRPKVTDFDKFVGERIREGRLDIQMSQKELGELIGVSFQQIQKYETGRNRVSGARFELLVSALRRPLAYFFPSTTDVRSIADPIMSQFISTKRGLEMAKKFPRLPAAAQGVVMKVVDEFLTKERAT